MKCCVSTDFGTWTNWLTFEPNPDNSPDAGTGLLSPISYALQCGILLRRENPTYRYWAPVAAARRGFKMVLFTASRGNTFVGGTCAPPSALLVITCFNKSSRLINHMIYLYKVFLTYLLTSNNMNLVRWPLMGGLLCLVRRGGAWAGRSPPRRTKCNSPPINGQRTNHRIAV